MQCKTCHKTIQTDLVLGVVPFLLGTFKEKNNGAAYAYYDTYFCSTECAKEYITRCTECGKYTYGDSECDCHHVTLRRENRDMKSLLSYQYRPEKFMFVGNEDNKHPYFGVELEMEKKRGREVPWNSHVKSIEGLLTVEGNPFFYCVHDGSLSDGIEIITHPFTWQWLQENTVFFEKIWSLSQDFSIRQSCGMHVHINKKAFKRAHLYRFLRIFYDNPRFFTALTRTSVRFANINTSNPRRDSLIRTLRPHNKYEAVNTLSATTVEVRIFKGVIHMSGFMRNMNIVRSLYWYTKWIKKPGSIVDYERYVRQNKEYASITSEITRVAKGLTTPNVTALDERTPTTREILEYMRASTVPEGVTIDTMQLLAGAYRRAGVA